MTEPQAMKMGSSGEIRASDAERSEIADLLKRHFMDGRLDQAELNERVGAALGAKTRGELSALLHDLPPIARGTAVPASSRRRTRRSLTPIGLICILGFLVIAAASSLSMHVQRIAIPHAGPGGQQFFITQSQRVFSLSPVLVAALLVAMICLALRYFRHGRDLEQ